MDERASLLAWLRALPPRGADALVAAGLLLVAIPDVPRPWDHQPSTPWPVILATAALVLVQTVPHLERRRWPLAVVVVTAGVYAVKRWLYLDPWSATFSLAAAFWAVAAYGGRRTRVAGRPRRRRRGRARGPDRTPPAARRAAQRRLRPDAHAAPEPAAHRGAGGAGPGGGPCGRAARGGPAAAVAARGRPVRLPDRAGGPDQRAQARRPHHRPGAGALRRRRAVPGSERRWRRSSRA